ncbi:MAG: extracellular solute-binding protein [Actinobacteria bacterium]|nr:extracellular solute-binding protein [Actinomycetota bacterium]
MSDRPGCSVRPAARRRWLTVAAPAAAALILAACGSAAGNGKNSSTSSAHSSAVTMWLVTTGPSPANTAIQNLVTSFDKSHPGDHITVDFVENQAYKQKIQLAMGAHNAPTIFWTWGGGTLQQYIKAGDVQSLGSHPSWASAFLPSSLGAVTYNGQLYGVPVEGTQPVYFFYNKPIFAKYHLTFPTTWSGLLSTIATLKSHGVAPISLANGDLWPGLMYLEYLTDRIGGPSVAQDLQANKPGAWSNPAVTTALTYIQHLAKAGAFQTGYDSLHYSGGGSDALVYSGKAAMQLMGNWDVSAILGAKKSFVNGGNLGMAPFPTIPGGSGNPADLAGNTASYVAISSHASAAQKQVAEAFFKEALTSTSYAKAEVAAGEVPVTKGAAPLFTGQPLASYDTAIYNSVENAPSFQYSWDQAMTPQVANVMLTNLAQVFSLAETPAKFESALNSQASSGS